MPDTLTKIRGDVEDRITAIRRQIEPLAQEHHRLVHFRDSLDMIEADKAHAEGKTRPASEVFAEMTEGPVKRPRRRGRPRVTTVKQARGPVGEHTVVGQRRKSLLVYMTNVLARPVSTKLIHDRAERFGRKLYTNSPIEMCRRDLEALHKEGKVSRDQYLKGAIRWKAI